MSSDSRPVAGNVGMGRGKTRFYLRVLPKPIPSPRDDMMGSQKKRVRDALFSCSTHLRRRFHFKMESVARVVVELIGEPSRLESRL